MDRDVDDLLLHLYDEMIGYQSAILLCSSMARGDDTSLSKLLSPGRSSTYRHFLRAKKPQNQSPISQNESPFVRYQWILSLTSSYLTHNYVQFVRLLSPTATVSSSAPSRRNTQPWETLVKCCLAPCLHSVRVRMVLAYDRAIGNTKRMETVSCVYLGHLMGMTSGCSERFFRSLGMQTKGSTNEPNDAWEDGASETKEDAGVVFKAAKPTVLETSMTMTAAREDDWVLASVPSPTERTNRQSRAVSNHRTDEDGILIPNADVLQTILYGTVPTISNGSGDVSTLEGKLSKLCI